MRRSFIAAMAAVTGWASLANAQERCEPVVTNVTPYVISARAGLNNGKDIPAGLLRYIYDYKKNMVCDSFAPNKNLGFDLVGGEYCYHGPTGLPVNPEQPLNVIKTPLGVAKDNQIEIGAGMPKTIAREFKALRPACLDGPIICAPKTRSGKVVLGWRFQRPIIKVLTIFDRAIVKDNDTIHDAGTVCDVFVPLRHYDTDIGTVCYDSGSGLPTEDIKGVTLSRNGATRRFISVTSPDKIRQDYVANQPVCFAARPTP